MGAAMCVLAPLAAGVASAMPGEGGPKHEKNTAASDKTHPDRVPNQPSSPPSFTVPVESLGFSAPSSFYLGQRFSLVSLDFLDENRLLFTFRVPGLIHRQFKQDYEENEGGERQIKAVVLALPSGAVQAEAVWPLHDRGRYLWALKSGSFLVRDRNELRMGDASLELKPFLRFPGPILEVGMDPSQEYLVTNSREPASNQPKSGEFASPKTAATAAAADSDTDKAQPAEPDLVLRILRRDNGQVMLVSRVRSEVRLPINSDGYLELLPGRNTDWVVNLNKFKGSSARVGEVESNCTPSYDFISQREFLVSACTRSDLRRYVAMDTSGRQLWEDRPTSSPVWPLVVVNADGSRLARESLAVNHPVTTYTPLDFGDIKGQIADVFDAATGKIVLTAPIHPIFDAGGNVAISPSGKRVAILNEGAIEVFDLPDPPPLPPDPAEDRASKATP